MKRLIVVLSGLMMLPAFAEVAPIFYDEVAEYTEEQELSQEPVTEDVEEVKVVTPVPQPSRISPRTASMASARAGRGTVVSSGSTNTRAVATRGNAASTRNATQARTAASRSAVNARARTTVASRAGVANSRVASRPSRNASTTNKAVTTRAASTTNKSVTARAGTLTADAPLYNSNARVGMRSSSAIRARMPSAVSLSSSSASSVGTSTEEKQEAVINMDELAQMTDYCKAQYTSCMDNFCNVLDDNQGRCSCSKNIKNYEKTELALKAATEALQDVSQQIQYIGLTADDIETLFTQTEAEIAMQSTSDNTQLKNDLDNIKDMIVGIKTGTATSSESGMSFDLSGLMNFNIDSTGFDLTGLFGGNTVNTSSISNQRGEQLYKTAAARCKASVLTSCQAQGVDIAVITNSYDLEIDRQCVAYERALTDSNENMNRTVRNAKVVLQKARLMVAQQKNAYDLRGCVNALDSCMQDDFVCGTDYENCLDPTGKYIVNGEVVIGSAPGYFVNNDVAEADKAAPIQHTKGLYATWNYANTKDKNAWYTAKETEPTNLAGYIADSISTDAVTDMDSNLVRFLQYKIGYVKDNKTYGMCASVLNKCQNYTYDDGKFKNDNQVVREYLQRTLTQIKVAQDEIISSYAENCISDVNSCLSSNNYTAQANYAINACKAQIVTCMSVNGDSTANPTPAYMKEWVSSVQSPESLVYVTFDLNGFSAGYETANKSLFEGRVYNPAIEFKLPTNSQTPGTGADKDVICGGYDVTRNWCYEVYTNEEMTAKKTVCKSLYGTTIPAGTKLASNVITLSCSSSCINDRGSVTKCADGTTTNLGVSKLPSKEETPGATACYQLDIRTGDNGGTGSMTLYVDSGTNSVYSASSCTGTPVTKIEKSVFAKNNATFRGAYEASDGSGSQCVDATGSISLIKCPVVANDTWYVNLECSTKYVSFNGACVEPVLRSVMTVDDAFVGRFYIIEDKAYEYVSATEIGGQITKITVPTKANATFVGATLNKTYNASDKKCIEANGNINVANCTGKVYAHWTCNSGYTQDGANCVSSVRIMNVVGVGGVPFSTIKDTTFVCSPDADTKINISDYVEIDTVSAIAAGLNYECIKLCYNSDASNQSVDNAVEYCTKVPANKCVNGGTMYLLLDEYCQMNP